MENMGIYSEKIKCQRNISKNNVIKIYIECYRRMTDIVQCGMGVSPPLTTPCRRHLYGASSLNLGRALHGPFFVPVEDRQEARSTRASSAPMAATNSPSRAATAENPGPLANVSWSM